ncbi:MAG TPA: cupin domain-containing protein [Solirubrobacteraceae bacterium]
MDTFNLFRDETVVDETDPPGYRAQSAQLAPRFGASRLAMTVYDLPSGQAICPYHFHWGDEEWLVVVSGTPSVRTPTGEQMLEPGDVVCFPVGPEGAHRVHNASDDAARVALFSNKHEFGIIEYPDSDKIGVWGRHDESLDHVVRRSPDLDYWDGERPRRER